jgi:uncharacterized protein (TIGR02145 family)
MKFRITLTLAGFILMAGSLTFNSCKKENPEKTNEVTDYDGNVYGIITIGTQQWLDRNLDVSHYRNGDLIPNGIGSAGGQGAWSNFNDNPELGEIYGKLYNAAAVHDARGLAPEGWHVATREEWELLISTAGGMEAAGGKLKETGTEHWLDPNTDATDQYGFKALPGGYGSSAFYYMGNYGGFYTSSKTASETETYMIWVYYNDARVEIDSDFGGTGYSVRCVKD